MIGIRIKTAFCFWVRLLWGRQLLPLIIKYSTLCVNKLMNHLQNWMMCFSFTVDWLKLLTLPNIINELQAKKSNCNANNKKSCRQFTHNWLNFFHSLPNFIPSVKWFTIYLNLVVHIAHSTAHRHPQSSQSLKLVESSNLV